MPDNPYQAPASAPAPPPDPVAGRIRLLKALIFKEVARLVGASLAVTMGFGAVWIAASDGRSSVVLNVGGVAVLLLGAGGFGLWACTRSIQDYRAELEQLQRP